MTLTTLVLTLLVTIGAGAGEASSADPVLLDFTATWCGPCQSMKPAVEELRRKGYPIKAVDIDRSPDLAERFGVTAVPTFIVVDRDGRPLARQSGACSASDLAALYQQGLARSRKVRAVASADEPTTVRAQNPVEEAESAEAPESPSDATLADLPQPTGNPWLTVVRIKVVNHYSRPTSIGFGSGTIIHSTADEAIILTCAHIFKIEEMGSRQPRPDQFPLRVAVDLFDGKLRESQTENRTPYMLPSMTNIAAEVIDYDYASDVGLIRIKTGRPLPYAKVVPPGWTPRVNMKMTTLGCSEGKPATAWSTWVTNPQIRGQFTGIGVYQGTECAHAPKQGRSGGGLFTLDGLVAGVCDFNDGPGGRHGLYAAPVSIHKLLDRNNLQICWNTEAPASRPDRAQLASRDRSPTEPRGRGRSEPAKVLAQSPDSPEASGAIPMPTPEIMNVRLPRNVSELAELKDESRSVRRYQWQPVPSGRIELAETEVRTTLPARGEARPRTTRLEYDERATEADLFLGAPDFDAPATRPTTPSDDQAPRSRAASDDSGYGWHATTPAGRSSRP